MTDKPTPTDAELEALLLDKLPASKHYIRPVIEKMVAAMQAAIDKWGTPAPVGVEPIGYLYCGGSYGDELADWEVVADQHQCDKLNEHHGALGKEEKLPIYTTQQTTHAQPVAREPLTPERVKEIVRGAGYDQCGIPDTERAAFINGLRHGEREHGIGETP